MLELTSKILLTLLEISTIHTFIKVIDNCVSDR